MLLNKFHRTGVTLTDIKEALESHDVTEWERNVQTQSYINRLFNFVLTCNKDTCIGTRNGGYAYYLIDIPSRVVYNYNTPKESYALNSYGLSVLANDIKKKAGY